MTGYLLLVAGIVLALVTTLAAFLVWPIRRPLATESDYTHRSWPWWYFYYVHKYLRPVQDAQRGSGLESYFRKLDFDFPEPDLFDARRFRLAAVGDLMPRRDLVGAGGLHLYDRIGERIFGADLVTGNLEFSINEEILIEETVTFAVPPFFASPLIGDARFGRFHYV